MIGLVNAAGHALVGMRSWGWLTRSDTLDIVATQPYVSLPSDFGRVINVVGSRFDLDYRDGTLEEVVRLRRDGQDVTALTLVGAIEWSSPTTSSRPVARLAISWPSPASNDTDALTIYYRARWVDVVDDQATLPIPEFMDGTYIQVLRAHARGWEEDDKLDELLNTVQGGPTYAGAVRVDEEMQPCYGPIQNGAVASRYPLEEAWVTTRQVNVV